MYQTEMKELRISQGLSQFELGKKAGLSGSAIGLIENGTMICKSSTLRKIGLSLDRDEETIDRWVEELAKTAPRRTLQVEHEAERIANFILSYPEVLEAIKEAWDDCKRNTNCGTLEKGTRQAVLTALCLPSGHELPKSAYKAIVEDCE